MNVIALLLAAASLMGCSGVLWWVRERFDRLQRAPPATYDDADLRSELTSQRAHIEMLTDALAELEEGQRDQTLAIAEGIERVDRAERRVRAAVGRARKRMEDLGYVDEGLEAEAAQLQLIDGDDGQEQRMHAMRAGMEGTQNGDSGPDMRAFPGRW